MKILFIAFSTTCIAVLIFVLPRAGKRTPEFRRPGLTDGQRAMSAAPAMSVTSIGKKHEPPPFDSRALESNAVAAESGPQGEESKLRELRSLQLRAKTNKRYGELLVSWGCTPREADEIRLLLLDRQLVAMNVMRSAQTSNLDARSPENRAQLNTIIKEMRQESEQKLRALLGQKRHDELLAFDKSIPYRNTVSELAERLEHRAPLQKTQFNQLVAVLADSHHYNRSQKPFMSQPDGSGDLRLFAPVTPTSLTEAAQILSPSQFDELKFLHQEQELQRNSGRHRYLSAKEMARPPDPVLFSSPPDPLKQ